MYCNHCGKEIMDEAVVCVHCGKATGKNVSQKSGVNQNYVVLQVCLKEKFWGGGTKNLTELENIINSQAAKGYRLHTMTVSDGGSKGFSDKNIINATLVFEKI